MTPDDVVSSRVYITDTKGFQEMNAAYREAFSAAPPARATVRAGLTGPDYLVEITMLAVKEPGRRVIGPARTAGGQGTPAPPPLSPGIVVGDRLFLSGMLGNSESTRGDAGAQTRETLARIAKALEAAGFRWADVVDATVYLTDITAFPAMNAAYREPFGDNPPARATVEAGLVAPDGLVEIMMTAAKGEKRYPAAGR
jgi:enamine deaminase RidA (YjgF/YER057c/UK114 family)